MHCEHTFGMKCALWSAHVVKMVLLINSYDPSSKGGDGLVNIAMILAVRVEMVLLI